MSKKILLLEPDIVLGNTYKNALQINRHKVIWYKDAQSAIRGLDQTLPDIIVAELQLAGHNGIEFLYELRSYSDWQYIPVILLSHVSPFQSGIDPSLWERLGIKSYHYKPFTTLTQLIHAIN